MSVASITACSYCSEEIDPLRNSDSILKCQQCHNYVQTKCLQRSSTPGDFLGDVFFDFTCAKCYDGPSSSSSVAREKFVRQRLPWLMVVTLTLYNLSIKAKGLSHHGYFHWRTHIITFIDKNWDFLFEPPTRRRKRWIGCVAGILSHNSPAFFQSGYEVFNKNGWWKLTHSNMSPKKIYVIYEQSRQQPRRDKRVLSDSIDMSNTSGKAQETKKLRRADSEDESNPTESCSRTIPYMGRKPKIAKQLNIVDDDISKNMPDQQPLNTVQSSLMDFLAESLGGDDLSMFNNFSNMESEPMTNDSKSDFLSLIETQNESASFLDVNESEDTPFHGFDNSVEEEADDKLSAHLKHQNELNDSEMLSTHNTTDLDDNSLYTPSECSKDAEEDEEYKPRIVQVTNFQQLQTNASANNTAILPNGSEIKEEIKSDAEQSEAEETDRHPSEGAMGDAPDADSPKQRPVKAEFTTPLPPCKPSLFTKQPRRNWPWLVDKSAEDPENLAAIDDKSVLSNESLVMMSAYEEKELLQKLRKIFSLEVTCQLEIPSYIRRFYRKLCVREWKREHSRPLFNLDEHLDTSRNLKQTNNTEERIIDRYQMIALSSKDTHKSFYARIAGSIDYEFFESPYSQRILHPFIYRSSQCFPPWLKLMCEIQYASSGIPPKRDTIDYCYVRPNHIAAVNALLQSEFWPGIDMTESLSYPDFSVVALYKKLVIGCGFLVPDVGFNEAYISFMAVRPNWQRSGIATFMLYHLIQTCMSKDITLHVSATNPAVVLYQKFGFKIEEVIKNFYDKYLPFDSKHSRHAFFLRLMR